MDFSEFEYQSVPAHYRKLVRPTKIKNHQPITDKLILDLLAGKTLLVDAHVPLEHNSPSRFRTLYNYFNSRGYNLQIHLYDDVDRGIFRGLLMWANKNFPEQNEREVRKQVALELRRNNKSNSEIASHLRISRNTVRTLLEEAS